MKIQTCLWILKNIDRKSKFFLSNVCDCKKGNLGLLGVNNLWKIYTLAYDFFTFCDFHLKKLYNILDLTSKAG
jgi:hypothetical protein